MPPSATPSVRVARLEDRDAVVRVLSRAFDADPILNYMLRQDQHRARAFAIAFDVSFRRLTLPHGDAWIADDGSGAALWTPPGRWSRFAAVVSGLALVRAVGLRRAPRIFAATERVQKKHPTQPHYYLFALGVDPDRQGRGVGSALLGAVLTRCDRERAPAYLEASTPRNVRLYERHGFRVIEEIRMADDAPPLWPMWREPIARVNGNLDRP